jgi:hypothetical protein
VTPAQARDALNRWLQRVGQDVTLQRLSAPTLAVSASVSVRAHVVDFAPKDLDGSIGLQIGDSKVIMSSTEVVDAAWPAAGESPIPRKGDRIVVAGRTRTVLYGYAGPYVAGELVRINLVIR